MPKLFSPLPFFALAFVAVSTTACGDRAADAPGSTAGAGGSGDGGDSGGGNGGLNIPTGGTGGEEDNPCLGPNPPDNCQLVPSGPACGDGEINQDYEDCDDGNSLPGDGCNGACAVEPNWECPTPGQPCISVFECGNGVIEPGEVCDDGNALDNDGCNATCDIQSLNFICITPGQPCERIVFCGDGRVSGEETCDDGNDRAGDGCDEDCLLELGWVCRVPGAVCERAPACGDGELHPMRGESCDDGNTLDGDGCDAICLMEPGWLCPTPGQPCQYTVECGDGVVFGNETCDDANTDPSDGCDNCQVQAGYECPFPGAPCVPMCGDGIILMNEVCDDENRANGDGCTEFCDWEDGWVCTGAPPNYSCRPTVCGDMVVEGTEACDDGNNDMGDGCTPYCDLEPYCSGGACTSICGDGLLLTSMGEVCDDGNNRSGDGCSSSCTVEAGYQCTQPPLGASMTVPVVYRDFNSSHVDFEPGAIGQEAAVPGLVQPTLVNGKPVRSAQSYGWMQSLQDWYTDVPGVNSTIVSTLTLWDNGSGGYVNRWGPNGEQWEGYANIVWCGNGGTNCGSCAAGSYDICLWPCTPWNNNNECGVTLISYEGNPVFFPIDNHPDALTPTGQYQTATIAPFYGGTWNAEPGGARHNFHFTSEVRYWFEYDASQTYSLSFTGDDDVWVFVNNRLVVDLGGIHTPQEGTINITPAWAASNGLANGQVYEIVVFQAERQTTASTYRLTLSGFNVAESDCGPICGDGVLSPGEQCDNGPDNGTGYGQCNTDCTRGPYCGDGIVNGPEQCDNGVNVDSYGTTGCAPGCVAPPRCGDGVVQSLFGERCDNGVNSATYGGCTPDCQRAVWCGDGIVNGPESCDDGLNDGTYGSCYPDCTPGPRCGDGVLEPDWGEDCDDGNNDPGDGCSPNCREEGICGDAILDPVTGEECDDGNNNGGYGECAPGCVLGPHCGDGVTNGPEDCDDGVNGGDYGACAPGCVLGPHCGDGLVQDGYEECDDGKRCVDGAQDGRECDTDAHCPDGSCEMRQLEDGDGCSAACKEEILIPM